MAHNAANGQQLGARNGANAQAGFQGIAGGGTQAAPHFNGGGLLHREAQPLDGAAQLRAGQPGVGLGGPRPLNSEIRDGPIGDEPRATCDGLLGARESPISVVAARVELVSSREGLTSNVVGRDGLVGARKSPMSMRG